MKQHLNLAPLFPFSFTENGVKNSCPYKGKNEQRWLHQTRKFYTAKENREAKDFKLQFKETKNDT